jgi:hypothetical protein
MQENPGERLRRADQDSTHTHVFGWNALGMNACGAAAWSCAEIGNWSHYAEWTWGRLREDGLADEGENGSQPGD